jgi:hypothetical protein
LFLDLAKHGFGILNDERITTEIFSDSEFRKHFLNPFSKGYYSFVMGHEASHLLLKHHRPKQAAYLESHIASTYREAGLLQMIKYPSLEEVCMRRFTPRRGQQMDQVREELADFIDGSLEDFDEEPELISGLALSMNILNQAKVHACEYTADAFSISGQLLRFLRYPESESACIQLLGAMWSIYAIDLLECSMRLLAGGSDFALGDLWHHDFAFDNQVLRGEHPSPFSRLAYILTNVKRLHPQQFQGKEDIIDNVMQVFVALRYNWMDWAYSLDIGEPNLNRVNPNCLKLLHCHEAIGGCDNYFRRKSILEDSSCIQIPEINYKYFFKKDNS